MRVTVVRMSSSSPASIASRSTRLSAKPLRICRTTCASLAFLKTFCSNLASALAMKLSMSPWSTLIKEACLNAAAELHENAETCLPNIAVWYSQKHQPDSMYPWAPCVTSCKINVGNMEYNTPMCGRHWEKIKFSSSERGSWGKQLKSKNTTTSQPPADLRVSAWIKRRRKLGSSFRVGLKYKLSSRLSVPNRKPIGKSGVGASHVFWFNQRCDTEMSFAAFRTSPKAPAGISWLRIRGPLQLVSPLMKPRRRNFDAHKASGRLRSRR
mmetsp:Transcript_29367/g.88866  ORF Transcript_29367/g.88866 Transcript_29367/m.88866 type:complete len:268 (+) Transcript_29367:307-1110(+)